jgi:hypothetical protein
MQHDGADPAAEPRDFLRRSAASGGIGEKARRHRAGHQEHGHQEHGHQEHGDEQQTAAQEHRGGEPVLALADPVAHALTASSGTPSPDNGRATARVLERQQHVGEQ